ncbi:MAG: peptidoglycan DD-metalloendopeptidase family protein [bacterium]|nr:peptidoglycan DD-metalloendopeptidase family protein [bacterium]
MVKNQDGFAHFLPVLLTVILAVIGFVGWRVFENSHKSTGQSSPANSAQADTAGSAEEDTLPKFIQADWIDISRIGSISKFRSSSGHDFSGNGETCRSMKHYFNALRTSEDETLINNNNGFPPPFSLEGAIPVYSPVDGKIAAVESDNGDVGQQIYIQPQKYNSYTVRLFHIFLLDGYKKGKSVKAGEQIGNIGKIQNSDIAVSTGGFGSHTFISYFEVMPDSVFAKYQALGIKNREELIITKEYRDAHPLQCNGEQFAQHYDGSNADEFVFINGSRH